MGNIDREEITWHTCPNCGQVVIVERRKIDSGYVYNGQIGGRFSARSIVIICLTVLLVESVAVNGWVVYRSQLDSKLYEEQIVQARQAGYNDGYSKREEQMAEVRQAGYNDGYSTCYDNIAWQAYFDGYDAGFKTAYPKENLPNVGTVSAQLRAAVLQHYADIRDSFVEWEKKHR